MEVINPMPIKEPKPKGRTPRYTAEYYMVMARDVVDNGMSFRHAADKYQCSHGTVSHWSKLYREGKLTERVEKPKSTVSKDGTEERSHSSRHDQRRAPRASRLWPE